MPEINNSVLHYTDESGHSLASFLVIYNQKSQIFP